MLTVNRAARSGRLCGIDEIKAACRRLDMKHLIELMADLNRQRVGFENLQELLGPGFARKSLKKA